MTDQPKVPAPGDDTPTPPTDELEPPLESADPADDPSVDHEPTTEDG